MNDPINGKKPMDWRGLASLVVTLGILLLAMTGAILYLSPQGRVANWTGWNVMGLGKEQWATVHTITGLLFVVASGFHVYFNWQTLIRYLLLKRKLYLTRELAGAVIVVAAVLAGTILEIPPFSGVRALNNSIKAHWESRSTQAPYPHAETSTLEAFCQQSGTSLPVLRERLAGAGITVDDPASQTLEDLAREAGLSPTELFAKISSNRDQRGHGAGLGRLSLQELCERDGLPLEKAMGVLRQQGFTVMPESTLKELAEQKGISPAEVRDLLITNYK